jgi:hypothetical protein
MVYEWDKIGKVRKTRYADNTEEEYEYDLNKIEKANGCQETAINGREPADFRITVYAESGRHGRGEVKLDPVTESIQAAVNSGKVNHYLDYRRKDYAS